jgi:hypothetical protein
MRLDSRMKSIEKTANEVATTSKQYAHSQAEFIEHTRETNHSQTNHLSRISNGIESCALEVKEQRNLLLDFQDKLKMYALSVLLGCKKEAPLTHQFRGLSTDEQHTMFGLMRMNFQQNEDLRRQNDDLRHEIKNIQTQNTTLLHHVLEVKSSLDIQRVLPSQVLLQQPVVLHDALGRIAPFHLEFIDSVAAFLAVLQIRFERVGRSKITRLEFDLRDNARQSPIALKRVWQGVFRVRYFHYQPRKATQD